MPTRHDAAIFLDIPYEMAKKHDLPMFLTQEELEEINTNPPLWLKQSRENRKGSSKKVWATLECVVCGYDEQARPKKWWPEFTFLACDDHEPSELPAPAEGTQRSFTYGVGTRFLGAVDEA